jgi:hypothetical protein
MTSAEEQYRALMKWYADDTMVLSFTKYDHPGFQGIIEMGMDAVPFLLKDVQHQHPDGSWSHERDYHDYSYWGACSLLWRIVPKSEQPVLPEKDRGRLAPIRKLWVDWGVAKGYLNPADEPTIPVRFDQIYRVVPKRFFGFRNFVWRLTTLPNKHRMRHAWDFWRAI